MTNEWIPTLERNRCLPYPICVALKDVKLMVPAAVRRGERVVLRCHYDIEGDQLYAVKWYKNDREFYRYTPRESPPIKQFPINGLRVIEEESNATHVVLDSVSMENTGKYSCEISADAPSFFTEMLNAHMEVVEQPKKDPQITGLKHRYRLDEILKAECVCKESRPAANLTWLVNGRPTEATRIRRHHTKPSGNGALLNSHSALRLRIDEELFVKGNLKIKCVASVYDIYYRSSEKSVELERMHRHKATTTTTASSMDVPAEGAATTLSTTPTALWEYALPAGRYPQSTWIFAGMDSSAGKLAASLSILLAAASMSIGMRFNFR
ncbi:PREDICTED: uncharacterized protein LOC108558095 [Nicrophorus vespilloides]|uniref:Uncharacterized protein LOC108558095 n=1 Tax=Nicrophorus vespilloides TaxID=110193 RepID=A0ABM1M741_NICVS|nr:PREDICTED: uncharacterized protein LOC108558095 [Nicrophorus vespilloides]